MMITHYYEKLKGNSKAILMELKRKKQQCIQAGVLVSFGEEGDGEVPREKVQCRGQKKQACSEMQWKSISA